ncbi:MAG: chitobiase/beta-hexosaminidase C-terminal domain-containing protein, partial [Phycisphaerae bacterium]|nr:chitobiase/beta-hexosaminidase C-terminal domain-containing protein [Phycisphaerae bacterium]
DGYTNVEEYLNGTDPRVPLLHVAGPAIEPEDGSIFLDSTQVTITCPTAGVEIRYTLDGSQPTRTSPRYSGPFELRDAAVVAARAFAGMVASRTSYAELRKVSPHPPAKAADLHPALAYEWSEPVASGPEGRDTTWTLARRDVVDTPRVDWLPAGTRWPKIDFVGYLTVPRDGVYTFTLSSPPSGELWIDGTRAILNDTGGDSQLQAVVALARGLHAIKVHYFTWTDITPLQLLWQGPGLESQPVPPEAFSHPATE